LMFALQPSANEIQRQPLTHKKEQEQEQDQQE